MESRKWSKKTRLRQRAARQKATRKITSGRRRRSEGGIRREKKKSVSFVTRELSIGRETQNCATGFSIFLVSSIDTRARRTGRGKSIVAETGPIAGQIRGGPRDGSWNRYYKKRGLGSHSFLCTLRAEITMAATSLLLSEYATKDANNI